MTTVPRIVRAMPKGPIHRPELGVPAIARLRWSHGGAEDVPVTVIAWTRDAVEIQWATRPGEELRTDWVQAGDVRRTVVAQHPDAEHPPTALRPSRGVGNR